MKRYRLKADGRIVAIGEDGSERAAPLPTPAKAIGEPGDFRSLRKQMGLSQTEFAANIGVPVDTVRNWEQGKRSPQGPARALLKLIERAPHLAFVALKS